ncbi:carboxypeptidase regulatory-like domain-containing protein [Ureibacillus composti]|nr:carboxypeptidase regulatory-like domain-containing protein [Ureibacillus composti]
MYNKLFSVLCIVLLVFSSVAPSIVFANSLNEKTIAIDVKDENRIINSGQLYVSEEKDRGGFSNQIKFDYDYSSTAFKPYGYQYQNIDPQAKYLVSYKIDYREVDGVEHTYIDQVTMLGAELMALEQLEIPLKEDLKATILENDLSSGNFDSVLLIGDNNAFEAATFNSEFNEKLVVKSNSNFPISFTFTTHNQNDTSINYFINDSIDLSKSINKLSDYTSNLVNVQFDLPNSQVIVSKEHFYDRFNLYENMKMTKGNYYVSYNANDLYWKGTIQIQSDTQIVLPNTPSELDVKVTDSYSDYEDPTILNLNYQVTAKNGLFEADVNNKLDGKLLLGDKEIATFTSNGSWGYQTIDMGKNPNGTYILLLETTIGDQVIKGEASIKYESPYQDLKGTVLTAENAEGSVMTDTEVTVYQENGYGFETVAIETANENGEVFIPDAFFLKDQDYILEVISEENKTAFVQSFVGQSTNQIHLEGQSLKSFKFDSNGLTEVDSAVSFGNAKSGEYPIYFDFITEEWKLSTNIDSLLFWTGQSKDGKVGYEYSAPIDFENGNSLEDIEWKNYKVASKYSAYDSTIVYFGESFTGGGANGGASTSDTSSVVGPREYTQINLAPNMDPVFGLKVVDGATTYKGIVTAQGNEVAFGEYSARVYHDRTSIHTYYSGQEGNEILITDPNLNLTYELRNSSGNITKLSTNNLVTIPLSASLADGSYILKLTGGYNKDIVTLNANQPFEVGKSSTTNKLPNVIYADTQTPYGQINNYSGGEIQIFEYINKYDYYYYNQVGHYSLQSPENGVFANYYSATIDPDKMYSMLVRTSVGEHNLPVIEIRELTGEEILSFSETNIFKFSENLNKLTVNVENVLTKNTNPDFNLMFFDTLTTNINSKSKGHFELYLSTGNYKGYVSIEDDTSRKFHEINVNLKEDKEITLTNADFAKIEVTNGVEKLPVFGFVPDNFYFNNYSYDRLRTEQYISKRIYDKLTLVVGKEDQFDTPWGYQISKENQDITQDTQYNFTGELTGQIEDIYVNEDAQTIGVSYELNSDDFIVERIYHAVTNPNKIRTLVANPIRNYFGLFDDLNEVQPNYVIKVANGKEVFKGVSYEYFLNYLYINLPKKLENGTYTVEMNIPTSPRKSLVLKENFTVGGEQGAFVNISSPTNNELTNSETVLVEGTATKNAQLTAVLNKGTNTVATKEVTVSAEGKYSVEFNTEEDGDYTVDVTNGSVHDSINFTVDRTPPAKATDITFEETAEGLAVTWKGATDASKYIVEVSKNDGDFNKVSTQTVTTYVIKDIEPGATYKVRIASLDTALNGVWSDIATKQIQTFVTTAITIKDQRINGLLVIGETLNITLEGSYKEGYVAKAVINVDDSEKEVTLIYNESTKKYEGSIQVEAGQKVIKSIKGYILDGTNKTNEKVQELNWTVGSTVTGSISNGDPVTGAKIVLKNSEHSYQVVSDAEGKFEIKPIKAGTYTVTSTINNRTLSHKDVVVAESEVKVMDSISVDAYVSPIINFVDSTDVNEKVQDGLFVRITGPNSFAAYGTTQGGKFNAYGGWSLNNIVTGEYTVTVFGGGVYNTTTKPITITKEPNYTIKVEKENVEEKDITIILPNDVDKIDYIYLYSPSIYQKFNYSGVGDYYKYDVTVEGNKVTFNKVVAGSDYRLFIAVDGYVTYNQAVDLSSSEEVTVTLDKGRQISGKVTDSSGTPVGLVQVYAYGADTYSSTVTDAEGNYTLKGLSKGDVSLEIYSQIYLQYNEQIDKGTNDVTKDIQLAKAASLTGKVVDKDGKPLASVSVSASGKDSNGKYAYGWGRTAKDGTFSINGLADNIEYDLEFSSYGYPTKNLNKQNVGDIGEITLQKVGTGNFSGEGNFLAVSKSTVVPGENVQFTLSYKNNGTQTSTNVPVTISLPEGFSLVDKSVQLNGKDVTISKENKVNIPEVKAGDSGKVTFTATVAGDVTSPSLTAKANITETGEVLSASTSVVYVTLEAPEQTASKNVKVYGTAKHGSTVEIYANNKLVGQAKVDSKWWFADIELPQTAENEEQFTITAKVTSGNTVVNSKPVKVNYTPSIPKIKDVTIQAGWNGDVKLNPYTGVATFAITEHTWMPTSIKFDKEVDSASLTFLGETYNMKKNGDSFTFDGNFGQWTSYGEQLLEVTFKKGDVEITLPLMNIIVLIDPSGYVFEGSTGNKLEGVQAIVEVKDGDNWVKWDAEKFGQVNPQVTDKNGRYGWDVITGQWRVIFTKEGYEPYISRIMSVPPAETELNIPMVKIADPSLTTSTVSADNLTVTFDRYMDVVSADIKVYEADGRTPVDGTVQAVDEANGYKSIATPENKESGFAGKDSKGQDGFFAEDTAKKVAKSFKFNPSSSLKADTNYVLVVNGDIVDTEGRELGGDVSIPFTTAAETGSGNDSGSGNGSGSGGSSGGGGKGGTSNPSTKESTSEVTEKDVKDQVSDATKTIVEVKANAISKENPTVDVAVGTEALQAVVKSGKSLIIKSGDVKVTVPTDVLKAIAKDATGKTNFTVKLVKNAKVPGNGSTLSDIYEFSITNGNTTVSNFAKPIVITVPVSNSVKDPNKVAAYYLNEETNELEFVISKYENGEVTFKTNHFSKFVVVENNKTFNDTTNSWAKVYVESLASRNIVSGKSVDRFAPNDSITRAQFALILTNILNLPTEEYEGRFKDVPKSMDWAVYGIEAAARAGIVAGSNGKFNPNDKITRQQMATMIVRAIEYVDPTIIDGVQNDVKFADEASIYDYAKENVQIVAGLGIVKGREVGGQQLFAPKENATRAQAATMLYNLLEQF